MRGECPRAFDPRECTPPRPWHEDGNSVFVLWNFHILRGDAASVFRKSSVQWQRNELAFGNLLIWWRIIILPLTLTQV